MIKKILFSAALSCLTSIAAYAVTIDPTFDVDSYIFRPQDADSSATDLQISEADPNLDPGGGYHFNFGVIEFGDLSGITTQGEKFLSLTPFLYPVPTEPGTGGGSLPSPLGSATVHIVALNAGYNTGESNSYLGGSMGAADWFDTYVRDGERVGTINFQDQKPSQRDVTNIVNSWITGDRENYGFALWSPEGSVLLYSDDFEDSADNTGGLTGVGPHLVYSPVIPEPSTYALFAGLAVLFGAMIYRKRK